MGLAGTWNGPKAEPQNRKWSLRKAPPLIEELYFACFNRLLLEYCTWPLITSLIGSIEPATAFLLQTCIAFNDLTQYSFKKKRLAKMGDMGKLDQDSTFGQTCRLKAELRTRLMPPEGGSTNVVN
jgi:hypothetical protein